MSRSAIAAAVIALVVLTGCGGTSQPSAPPTSEDALTTATTEPNVVEETTEAAPTTEAPEETESADGPPEMSKEAKEQTVAGAEAFVEHYVAGLNFAYATGEVHHMAPLSGPECDSCSALLEGIPSNPEGEPTFQLGSQQTELIGDELARVESNMTVLRGAGAGDGVLVFDLSRKDEDWLVDSIRLQESP